MRLFCPVGGTGGGPTAEHFPDLLWRYFLNSVERPIRRVFLIATPSRLAGDKISMPKLIARYEALGIRCGVSFKIVDEEQQKESDIDEQSDALCITCGQL